MARKKLLTEGEVRQFMKLANLGPLSENYFSNNPLEEEELEDELGATEDELGAEDQLADEEADELGALDAEGGDEDNEALLARVVQAVAAELGVEVDVEGADEEGGEELEVDAELEEPLPGGGELEMGAEEEELPGSMDMYQETTKQGEEIDEVFGGVAPVSSTPTPTRKGAAGRRTVGGPCKAEVQGNYEDGIVDKNGNCVPQSQASAPPATGTGGLEEKLDHDAIVAEVARRVAGRLSAAKKKEALADQLAERIFKRLTAK